MSTGWKFVKQERDKLRNQIKNPSLELSVNNWTASGGTFTRSSEQSYEGAYSGKFVAGAATQNVKSNGVNLSNGQSIAATLYTYRATSTPQGTVTIYDATNAAVRATSTIAASAEWEIHNLLWTNTTGGLVSVELRLNNSTADSASVIYFDAAMLTYTSYNVLWFDGDRAGCKWVGTRHESVSDLNPFSVSGGRVYDLEDDYDFRVTRSPGAGNAPIATNYLHYAIAPGGSYQNSAIGVRDWALTGWIKGESTHEHWHTARKNLLQEFNPNRYGSGDPVLIRYTGTNTRQIEAYFNGGLEDPNEQLNVESTGVRLVSTDPFWRSPNQKATLLNTETSATMELIFAKIDGLWDVLGPPDASGTYAAIYAIAVAPDGKIYIGGDFANFDNQATGDYLAYYDKATDTWGVVAALNGPVQAIAISAAGIVYFAGAFTNAGGVAAADNIAQWDGSSVTAVGTPNTGAASITSINSLVFDGQGRLWLGGTFTNLNDNANADYVCYWDGTGYYALSTGSNGTINALAYDAIADRIYMGGEFTSLGGVSAAKIGYYSWPESGFGALGTGTTGGSNVVYAVAVDAVGGVYAGGTFDTWNGVTVNRIGYWNGVTAVAMGTGVDSASVPAVKTVAINEQGEVWIGGQFDEANGVATLDRVTIWNQSVYYNPPFDMPGSADVNTLTWDGDDVYIGTSVSGTVKYSNTTTVTNNGTEPANPIFQFKRTGGTSAKLNWIENTTTGTKFIADYSFLAGEEIVIDLRPGKRRFVSTVKNRGGSTINIASDTSDFYLIPGDNVLACYFTNDGATIAGQVSHDELFTSFD